MDPGPTIEAVDPVWTIVISGNAAPVNHDDADFMERLADCLNGGHLCSPSDALTLLPLDGLSTPIQNYFVWTLVLNFNAN